MATAVEEKRDVENEETTSESFNLASFGKRILNNPALRKEVPWVAGGGGAMIGLLYLLSSVTFGWVDPSGLTYLALIAAGGGTMLRPIRENLVLPLVIRGANRFLLSDQDRQAISQKQRLAAPENKPS